MNEARSHMTERILRLTLEIIYLLTGEDYVPARKSSEGAEEVSQPRAPGKLRRADSRAAELPLPSTIEELKNDQKILELAKKMIELLTGEVPLRYEDIIVCFTLEEWEYVDGHKDLYMDAIKENQEPSGPADKSPLRITHDENIGKCNNNRQNQRILPHNPKTCKPGESITLNFSSHTEESTADPRAEPSPEQTQYESLPIEEEPTINDERHRKESESYPSSQPPAPEYSSQIEEESNSSEDSHYEVSCVFPPAEQEDCEYLYITEDGNTHVSGNKLTIMACSACGDRFTVESDDARSERLQPYRCRKCSSRNSGTDVREVAISEVPRTSNLAYEDYEKGNVDCKKSFVSRKHLKINRRKKACSYTKWGGSSEGDVSLDGYNVVPEEERVFCSHCGKCFNHQASLELHQKTHMVEKASFISPSGKYLRNKALKSHHPVQVGGKQYNCTECGKSFKRNLSLVEHMQLHTGQIAFTCPDCGQSFAQRSAYVTHHKVHRAGKLHFCIECGKSFRTKADLTTHQRIHMGETPFPCPECGESFTRRANLVRHQRIHTGEKPFSCPDCGKCFTRKLGLMKHQKIHSGEKVYKREHRKNAFSMYRVIV